MWWPTLKRTSVFQQTAFADSRGAAAAGDAVSLLVAEAVVVAVPVADSH